MNTAGTANGLSAEPLLALLKSPLPSFSEAEILRLVSDVFGLTGRLDPLPGERDQNFRLSTEERGVFIVKIANGAEEPGVHDLQNQALLAVADADPTLPVPRLCRTLAGAMSCVLQLGQKSHTVRVVSFLPGDPRSRHSGSARLRAAVGQLCARLDRCWRNFAAPRAERHFIWDLQCAGRTLTLGAYLENLAHRQLVAHVHQRFLKHTKRQLPHLRRQVIHNDFNSNNILVDPRDPERIIGLIDFSDLVYAPMVIDLAVAAAHECRNEHDPLAAAGEVIAAYNGVLPLRNAEIDLLYDLICTRMAMGAAIRAWRVATAPEIYAYSVARYEALWRTLDRVVTLGPKAVTRAFRAACMS